MLNLLAIFLTVTLASLGIYSLMMDLFFQKRPQLRGWLDQELRKRQRDRARRSVIALKQLTLPAPTGAPAARHAPAGASLWRRLEVLIEQAGLFLSPGQLLALSAGGGMVAAVIGAILLAPEIGLVAGVAGTTVPFIWLFARRRALQREMLRQLPRAFELMARVIRAGQSVPQALAAVVEEFDPPLATDFAYCQEQQRLGLLPEVSFRELAQRSPVMELKIFVMAMLIQQRTGGNLSELLDRLAGLIRARVRIEGVIRAATAEGRLQAQVLIALPPLMFLLMFVFYRPYAEVLLEHYELLIAATVSMGLGAWWIHRIVHFDF